MTDRELLELPEACTLEDLKKRWQVVALELHPDHGGDAAVFRRVRAAYERLKAELSEQQTCGTCEGKGAVKQVSGFFTTTLQCPDCNGTGQVPRG